MGSRRIVRLAACLVVAAMFPFVASSASAGRDRTPRPDTSVTWSFLQPGETYTFRVTAFDAQSTPHGPVRRSR